MSLLDIDPDTPRRIEGITADGLRALGEIRERAKEIDKAADEMFARQERMRQELDEQVKQAAAQNAKPEDKPEEPKPRPKPSTLALGADEFKEARQARKAAEEPKPAEAPKPAPPTPEEPPRPGKTLKLGARDDEEEAPRPNRTLKLGARDDVEEPKPVRKPRPPRPESDDDMSGRTWLR
ncbi:MAG: hypothetical protein M3422_05140 [Actinomycetota bacterium]|nr:hypothetical protein [Actinomycetota bacterium]